MIAKSTVAPVQSVTTPVTAEQTASEVRGFPNSLCDFFNISTNELTEKSSKKIKDIYDWAKEGSGDLGDVCRKISQIEMELGSPRWDERRYDKVWLWVEMTKKMSSIDKQRQSLRRSL